MRTDSTMTVLNYNMIKLFVSFMNEDSALLNLTIDVNYISDKYHVLKSSVNIVTYRKTIAELEETVAKKDRELKRVNKVWDKEVKVRIITKVLETSI